MNTTSENNKRIAKNTLLLYFRMMLTMIVSLYTSRVVLNALGVEDFGIYNVVGGVVAMFNVLSGSLSAAISRFITYELGKENKEKLKTIFSSAVTIQLALGLIITLIAETIGLWFLNVEMNIPESRMVAANWVYQFSIITFIINLISVPYNAAIIAHEKMSAFAYISILEVIGKLLIAYLIVISPIDKLTFYAILMCVIALIIRFVYGLYCKQHFEECTYKFIIDKNLLKEMFGFAGWNFLGAGSWQLMTQGVNILLNIYFGVAINAARGIATQIDNALILLVNNFTTAVNPQITKSYASKNYDYMYSLIFKSAKFSYFLLLIFAIPIICETNMVLKLWLDNVPSNTISFVRLALVTSMIHILSNSMVTAMLATGNIKKYQIIVGGLGMLVLPLAWFSFYIGFPAEMAYITTIIIFLFQLICRLYLLNEMIGMDIKRFIKEVLFKVIFTSSIACLFPVIIYNYMEEGLLRFFIVI